MPISRVKNMIHRALRGIIDLDLTRKQESHLWEYFEDACAYCGCPLKKKTKNAHMDHLIPVSKNGTNHVSNRVLSCARCNEHEKKDMDWEAFLRHKNPEPVDFEARKERILDWQRQHGGAFRLPRGTELQLKASASAVCRSLELEVQRLKTRSSSCRNR